MTAGRLIKIYTFYLVASLCVFIYNSVVLLNMPGKNISLSKLASKCKEINHLGLKIPEEFAERVSNQVSKQVCTQEVIVLIFYKR